MSNRPTTQPQKGPKLEHYQVLLRPIITEKGTHMVERQNVYAFQVHSLASKTQIRAAVEEMFNVRVEDVRTQNRKGKVKRQRVRKFKTSDWKMAYVKLTDDSRISLF